MPLLKYFDAKEAKSFGTSLAEIVIERTPTSAKVLSEKRLTKIHEAMLGQLERQVLAFGKTHALNFYTKAQLGNVFKWALLEKKYDPDYVDQLTTYILHRC